MSRPADQAGAGPPTRAHLAAFARWARGDPALAAWEEQFLVSIARLARLPGERALTPRQLAVLRGLELRLGWPDAMPATVEAVADQDCLSDLLDPDPPPAP